MTCLHIKSGSYCKICESKPEKKAPKPLRKVSVKRVVQNREYEIVRLAYLKVFPICEVENCNNKADQIHHKAGREGERLTDINHFLAVCDTCHKYIHENVLWSHSQGYMELRSN